MIQSLTLGPLPTDVQQQHERWGGWRWKQQLEGATVGIVHRAAQRILQHTACQQEHDAKCTGTRTGGTARTSDPTRVLTHFFFPRFVLWDWQCCLGCALCSSYQELLCIANANYISIFLQEQKGKIIE